MTTLMMNELAAYSLRNNEVDQDEIDTFLDRMSDEEFSCVEAALADLMEMEVGAGRAEALDPQTRQRVVLHSIVHGRDPKANKLVAFSFSHAFKETILPLGSLIASVAATHHFGAVNWVQAGTAVRSLVKSLAILRSPDDDDAIKTARAVGVLCLKAKNDYSKFDPSNANLRSETGLSESALGAALKRLTTLNIIVNTVWGGQAEDYSHVDNRWSLRV